MHFRSMYGFVIIIKRENVDFRKIRCHGKGKKRGTPNMPLAMLYPYINKDINSSPRRRGEEREKEKAVII